MTILRNNDKSMCKYKLRGCLLMVKASFVVLILLTSHTAMAVQSCLTTITASTPTADFVIHNNGTVTHTKTGLMWKKCSEGLSGTGCAGGSATLLTWRGALQQAKTVNFAGYTDWRVPNLKELASIVEEQCANASINSTIFPATVTTANNCYWSASPYVGTPTEALNIPFSSGNDASWPKSASCYVRLVRGGL